MSKSLKIYIAGPYTATTPEEVEVNVIKAIELGIQVYQKGHIPLIPHLMHYFDKVAKDKGITFGWQDYMNMVVPWMLAGDAILRYEPSRGADIELSKAREAGKIIYLH